MSTDNLPAVTIGLMSFNQADTIEEAFQSIATQDYEGTVEVLISDDGSSDSTYAVLSNLIKNYDGAYTIRDISTFKNQGLIKNVNRIFEQARHDIVFLAAGDDRSSKNRIRVCSELLASDSNIMAVHGNIRELGLTGQLFNVVRPPLSRDVDNPLEISVANSILIGATGAYRRDVFLKFGAIQNNKTFEDLVLPFRAVLLGQLKYLPEILVEYRIEGGLSNPGIFSDKRSRRTARLKGAQRNVAVLQQRQNDAFRFGFTQTKDLIKKIQEELDYRRRTVDFYEDRRRFYRNLLKGKFKESLRVTVKEYPYEWSKKDLKIR